MKRIMQRRVLFLTRVPGAAKRSSVLGGVGQGNQFPVTTTALAPAPYRAARH